MSAGTATPAYALRQNAVGLRTRGRDEAIGIIDGNCVAGATAASLTTNSGRTEHAHGKAGAAITTAAADTLSQDSLRVVSSSAKHRLTVGICGI